jgi:hypothetical protein
VYVQSSANTSATNITAKISLAELCFIATDNISLSNELQNAISAMSVIQTSTLKTAKEWDTYASALRTIQPTDSGRVFSVAGNFKTKIRSRMKFRVLNALVFFLILFFK